MNHLLNILFFLLPVMAIAGSPVQWKAQWIMHPEVDPASHAVVLFRKQFTLEQLPDSFLIHVSADNHYRLYVNGHYLLRGPARGDFAHWFYETIDVAAYLQPGKNVLAAEVVNWGPHRPKSVFSRQTSFLLQGASEEQALVNTGTNGWRCLHNKACYPKAVDGEQDYRTIDIGPYMGPPTDSIRADQYPWGWESPAYDDARWQQAIGAGVAAGRENPPTGGDPITEGRLLTPRTVPRLAETAVPFAKIRSTMGLSEGNSYINEMGSLVIPAYDYVILLIDQTHLTAGYPEMIVSGGKDAIIQAMYAENLITGHRAPKGNRNEIEGKYMAGVKDVFVPDGGKDRLFRPTSLRSFRYIQLNIETFREPLVIENYYHVECRAPLDLKAQFTAGNELTDWIMEAGWRTISLCAQDQLLSAPYHQPLQCLADTRVHTLSLLALSGDDRLPRQALVQFSHSCVPQGLPRACYPCTEPFIIPAYSLIWIDQLHDYLLWKDDREFLMRFEGDIQKVLHWFEQRIHDHGLLDPASWQDSLARQPRYPVDPPAIFSRGGPTLYSLHYAYTLRHAANLLRYLGNRSLEKKYRTQAKRLCRRVNQLCKNNEGFYTESPEDKRVSQITNIMAILSGAVKPKKARALMQQLLEPGHSFLQPGLFGHLYLFEALTATGLQEQFLSELSEWQLMKDRGLTTFAEAPLEWGEETLRSECRSWSCAPNYFFFRTVCGISSQAPGHREIAIAPSPGSLTEIKAVYPHHVGLIELNLKRKENTLTGTVTVPEGMKATFIWNRKKIRLSHGKQEVSF